MRAKNTIIKKFFQRKEVQKGDEERGMTYNVEYQKGYTDALFWVLNMSPGELNDCRVVIEC